MLAFPWIDQLRYTVHFTGIASLQQTKQIVIAEHQLSRRAHSFFE
jgi:hypothetical protein